MCPRHLADTSTSFVATATGSASGPANLSRRQLLKWLALTGTAAFTLPALVSCQPVQPITALPAQSGVAPCPQLLCETLTAQFADVGNGRMQMAYSRLNEAPRIPGPILRVSRGTDGGLLRINLRNQLQRSLAPTTGLTGFLFGQDQGDCSQDMNTIHGLLTTNLHTHGLHVAPDKASNGDYADNVFVAVLPPNTQLPADCHHTAHDPDADQQPIIFEEEEVQFSYDILPEHEPGTHWYHAHKHGAVSVQVSEGLFGALIIEDEDRDMIPPYIRATREREQVLFITSTGENRATKWLNERGEDLVAKPLKIARGEVQRWRIINASTDFEDQISFTFNTPSIHSYLIAYDGIMLNRRFPVTFDSLGVDSTWENLETFEIDKGWSRLAPGNRADFLVRVAPETEPGIYNIEIPTFSAGLLQMRPGESLAVVEVTEDEVNSPWDENDWLPGPQKLPDLSDPALEIDESRTIVLGIGGVSLQVNGIPFDSKVHLSPLRLNTVEEWTIIDGMQASHPFHIHVNPFFVTKINDIPLEKGHPFQRWQDTVAVPRNGSVTFRTVPKDFTGNSVFHCHNLDHEDSGMMQVIKLVAAAS